ncbi:TPA: redox-regulated ATPase YchF, partial [Candidatus Micrarchaeota archaeon]|nr:redox-regulated ATPase YchF [Candidatus Micrarchaeota archaeon]
MEFLEKEIDLWFYGIVHKNWAKVSRIPFKSRNEMLEQVMQILSGIGATVFLVEKAMAKAALTDKPARDWNDDDLLGFARELRKASKPIVVAANKADKPHAQENI